MVVSECDVCHVCDIFPCLTKSFAKCHAKCALASLNRKTSLNCKLEPKPDDDDDDYYYNIIIISIIIMRVMMIMMMMRIVMMKVFMVRATGGRK